MKVLKHLKRCRAAAISIQRCIRGYLGRKRVKRLLGALYAERARLLVRWSCDLSEVCVHAKRRACVERH